MVPNGSLVGCPFVTVVSRESQEVKSVDTSMQLIMANREREVVGDGNGKGHG